jgi:thymidylate synthase
MKQYLDVVRTVLGMGTRKENRTGVDTLSTFGVHYSVDLREGFPLLTTKAVSWKNIVVENLWFLSGSTNVDSLRKHGCRFWDPWVKPESRDEVASAYGSFWRRFPVHELNAVHGFSNDQVAWALSELKRNPMSRRLVVSAWAPGNAQTSTLPPCHVLWALNVQLDRSGEPYLCLHLTQRSCDVALGLPYNLAGYALILELFAKLSGLRAGIFAHTLVDAHIYTSKPDGSMAEHDHVPGLTEQLTRAPRQLPRLRIADSIRSVDDAVALLDRSTEEMMAHFILDGYDPHPAIRFKVAV